MNRRPGTYRKFLQTLDLPLLRKDLTELAVRRRTYVVRVLYAILLLSVSWWSMATVLGQLDVTNVDGILGSGKQIFRKLMLFQTCGLLLLTPAAVSGSITLEKERNTLGLLFLTRLGPWGILFEKLISRLVPVFTFLLLSMPLFAVAYSFGGVDTETMVGSAILLFSLALEIAALSLFCSTYFRTTAGAFIWSYLLQGALMLTFGWPFVSKVYMFLGAQYQNANIFVFGTPATASLISVYGAASGFCGFCTILFLVASRFFLFRRAFLKPKQLILKIFKKLDRVFFDMNERYTKGVVLISETVELPDDQPIAWRETKKRSLGTVRYLFRVFVIIEIPLLFFCLLAAIDPSMADSIGLSLGVYIAWILAVLILTVQSSGLISSERSRETLNVLLTTSLTSREIIIQKFAGVRRATMVLRIPLLTVCIFEIVIYGGISFGTASVHGFYPWLYLLCSLLAMWIYPMLVGWLGLFVSLYVKNQSRAVLTTLGVILAWCCLVPLTYTMVQTNRPRSFASRFVLLAGPASIVGINESIRVDRGVLGVLHADDQLRWRGQSRFSADDRIASERHRFTILVVVNFLVYGFIAFALRARCLSLAARKLGRNDGQQKICSRPRKNEESTLASQLTGMESKI